MNERDLTCKEMVELVTDYLEGNLSAAQRFRFEDHLSECEGCTNYVEQMRKTVQITGQLSEADVSPEAERELLAIFRNWKRAQTSD
jgi:predicted anti-sigma-YlaC factor YlaD